MKKSKKRKLKWKKSRNERLVDKDGRILASITESHTVPGTLRVLVFHSNGLTEALAQRFERSKDARQWAEGAVESRNK